MKIIGIGTDIVEIERLRNTLLHYGDAFRMRVFTPTELGLGHERNGDYPFFAGRWAAKEALSKALGCGIGSQCSFTDIEVVNAPDGRPVMRLSGTAEKTMKHLGGSHIHLSISHEHHYAVATVLITD